MKVPNHLRVTSLSHPDLPPMFHTTEMAGNNGAFYLPAMTGLMNNKSFFFCIATSGMGWDHVSVTIPPVTRGPERCPTWEEMCYVKSFFWDDEEECMQLHPPKSNWVDNHPFCLHLWRPQLCVIPLPPSIMVGIK